jgi:hypothetical protein
MNEKLDFQANGTQSQELRLLACSNVPKIQLTKLSSVPAHVVQLGLQLLDLGLDASVNICHKHFYLHAFQVWANCAENELRFLCKTLKQFYKMIPT